MVKTFVYDHLLGHDAIYDTHYFESTVEAPAVESSEEIAGSVMLDLEPNTVANVGCGTGALLEALRTKGCQVLEWNTPLPQSNIARHGSLMC